MSSATPLPPSPVRATTQRTKRVVPKAVTKPAPRAKLVHKSVASSAKPVSHPSWKDMIKECIITNKQDARHGVSRNTIKKFAEEKYKIDVAGTNLFQLKRAITSGSEAGIFLLPKGPSGKVKLVVKVKPVAIEAKENTNPTKTKPSIEKPGKDKPIKAAKKVLAGKVKSASVKKKVAPSKRGAMKKAVTGRTLAKVKPAKTKKAIPKKSAPASTTAAKAKPTSKSRKTPVT